MNGIVGEAMLARPFGIWLQSFGVPHPASDYFATGLVVVIITYFSIVLGELVPKRIDWIFEIVDLGRMKIDKVLAPKKAEPANEFTDATSAL